MITKNAIDIARDFIARWEGFEPKPYRDIAHLWTIGYGHLIKDGESFTSLTQEEALNLLEQDMTFAIECVDQYVDQDLEDAQFAALISLCFNIGCGNFRNSTLVKLINSGNTDLAGRQFLRWIYAGGKKSQGLWNRRTAEKELWES